MKTEVSGVGATRDDASFNINPSGKNFKEQSKTIKQQKQQKTSYNISQQHDGLINAKLPSPNDSIFKVY